MGGKGSDSSSNDMMLMQQQQQAEAQRKAAAEKQKAAATEPVTEAPKKEEETVKEPTPVVEQPKQENLTGLGDQLISGLSEGRMQQVADQTERLNATPQNYGKQFDPYTGTFVGQGPYTGGQV